MGLITTTGVLTTKQRKKPRMSLPQGERDDDEESYGSLLSSDVDMNGTQDEPITEPEDEDEEEDTSYRTLNDEEAIKRLEEQRRRDANRVRVIAENAIIEEIHCTNFMCHGNLTIKVGPLINFIIGHNGSGKSAVLTALSICLGGKASATNRGGSLKSFIKEGKDKCTLSVKIKNQGKSAYKPELYGPTIIVERYFGRSSASGYNLKSSTGKKISTKREDLDDLLDFYMLQIDNPMNVLTQDMARQFLNSSSAADKYKFFQKGTQLERLDADYRETSNYMEKLDTSQREVLEATTELRASYEAAKKNSQSIAAQQKTQQKINQVKAQLCWVQVEGEEKALEDIDNSLRQTDIDIQEHQASFEDASQRYTNAERRVEQLEAKKAEIAVELNPLQEIIAELMDTFRKNKEDMVDLQAEERNIHTEISATKNRVAQCTREIDEEKERLETQSGGRSNEIAVEIEGLVSKAADARRTRDQHRESKERMSQLVGGLSDTRQNCIADVESRRNKVDACKRRISDLEQGGGTNNMSHELRQVLADIDKEKRFRAKPVGPMWKHVSLKDQQWSSVLEVSFGAALDAFCVTSKQDQDLLAQIFQKRKL